MDRIVIAIALVVAKLIVLAILFLWLVDNGYDPAAAGGLTAVSVLLALLIIRLFAKRLLKRIFGLEG